MWWLQKTENRDNAGRLLYPKGLCIHSLNCHMSLSVKGKVKWFILISIVHSLLLSGKMVEPC